MAVLIWESRNHKTNQSVKKPDNKSLFFIEAMIY